MTRNVHVYFSKMQNETRLFKIARTLSNKKIFDEIFIIGRASADLPYEENLYDKITILRLDVPLLSLIHKITTLRIIGWYFLATWKVFKLAPQCLSVHSVSLLPLALVVKAFLPKMLIIYETHELETETNGASHFKRIIRRLVEKIAYSFIHHTVTVSPSICSWYSDSYQRDNVSLVLNCPHYIKRVDSNCLREKFDISKDKVVFLYQGIMSAGRGIEKVVEAFEKLPQSAVLILLGYGPDFEKWQKASERLNYLYVHPVVPFENLLKVTASADCGISFTEDTCLSYRFSLPNKLFEFIQARLPVIVSPTFDQANLVNEAKIGLVCESFEVEAMVSACENFLCGYTKVTKSNLDAAAAAFCWETQEDIILNAYKPIQAFDLNHNEN